MVSVENFIEFVRKKEVDRIKSAVRENHFDLDRSDSDGRTALHHAVLHGVISGDLEMVKCLLDLGADVNIKDESTHPAETALHVALRMGHLDSIKLLLETSSLDVVKCDSFLRQQIIPEKSKTRSSLPITLDSVSLNEKPTSTLTSAIIHSSAADDDDDDDVISADVDTGKPPSSTSKHPSHTNSTPVRSTAVQQSASDLSKSMEQLFLLLVRQSTRSYVETISPVETDKLTDIIIIQDEQNGISLGDLIQRVDYSTLSALYVVDCKLQVEGDELFEGLRLKSLVLSSCRLRNIPASVFRMGTLEVLKVDRNSLEEISTDLVLLQNLTTFCCDRQKPRLKALPRCISQMKQLQVVSVSNNRLEDIQGLAALQSLRVLRCDRNRISRLPVQMAAMKELQVLDVSHNRIESIPAELYQLLSRLYRFDYYSVMLRPKHVVRDRSLLSAHLELDLFLSTLSQVPLSSGSSTTSGLSTTRSVTARDISIGLVGESRCGKSTLYEALRLHERVTSSMTSQAGNKSGTINNSAKSGTSSSSASTSVVLDGSDSGSLDGDLSGACGMNSCYLSAVELSNSVMDAYSRSIEVDMYVLTLDLTTFQIHNGSRHLFARQVNRLQMWLQALYEISPDTPVMLVGTHADQLKPSSFSDVWRILEKLLEHGRGHHIRRYSPLLPGCLLCGPRQQVKRRTFGKPRAGTAGFVDASYPQSDSPTTMNGHVGTGITEDVATSETSNRYRFPHVVAYYETDAKKKDSKKPNTSIEQLREAITRLTLSLPSSSNSAGSARRIPRSWVAFFRALNSIAESSGTTQPNNFVTMEDVKQLARNCDVPPSQIQHLLRYGHRRGRLVYLRGRVETSGGGFSDMNSYNDDVLSKLIVSNASWYVQRVSRLFETFEKSRSSAQDLIRTLSDKDFESALIRTNSPYASTNITGRWMLAAFQKLEMCLTLQESDSTPCSSRYNSNRCLTTSGLAGASDVLYSGLGCIIPSYPGNSQIVRSPPDDRLLLIPTILEYGSPSSDVWPDNPEWEEKQITCDFGVRCLKYGLFTELVLRLNDDGRRFLKIVQDPVPVFLAHHIVFFSALDQGGCDDCYSLRRRMRAKQKTDLDSDVTDDVLHKVHIMLHARMDAIRVQVRGVSPCCTMKAVLNFLELYLDDLPEEELLETSSDGASVSSKTTSSASPSVSGAGCSSDGHGSLGSFSHESPGGTTGGDDDDDRELFLLCPKCVLLRQAHPGRIAYHCISPKRKAICRKWHNLGSWSRAATGDYRFSSVIEVPSSASLTMLPDYEHPRLVLVLPPSPIVSNKDWYMFCKTRFLEGFEVHFLCEYTGYWHMTEDAGYRLGPSAHYSKKPGNPVAVLLSLALPLIQIIQGIPEHSQNGRLVAPVVADLIKVYDYLSSVDPHIHDTYTWLTKNKDRVVHMLTKVLAAAGDGMPDLYFKVNNAINAHSVFQATSSANRSQIARFLRIDASSGRFGALRPLYVEKEIRWVCEAHFEELRNTAL